MRLPGQNEQLCLKKKKLHQNNQAIMSHTQMYYSLPRENQIQIPSLRTPRLTLWCTGWRIAQSLLTFKKKVSILFFLLYMKRAYWLPEKCLWDFDRMNTGVLNVCEFKNAYFASFFLMWYWYLSMFSIIFWITYHLLSYSISTMYLVHLHILSKGSNILDEMGPLLLCQWAQDGRLTAWELSCSALYS